MLQCAASILQYIIQTEYLSAFRKMFPYSSAESDEFSRIPKPNRRWNESNKCEPRRNIASGTTTGFEVFLRRSRSEDSLQEGQRDKSGARVSS
jgi:hypothetical protein